jgi:alanine racemase
VIDVNRAAAVIDLSAIGSNLDRVRELAGSSVVMAVVKADAYGHGMVPVAQAARRFGAEWLGVALPSEAVALREAGDVGPILAWLWTPGDPSLAACVITGVDVAVSNRMALDELCAVARQAGVPARVQVKLDTGLSRNGLRLDEWPDLVVALLEARDAGLVDVTAIWSHLADADNPGSTSVPVQRERYLTAVEIARGLGLRPGLLHLSNSGGLFAFPDCRFDLVRVGIAMYGLAPAPGLGTPKSLGLTPAMTLRARLAHVKQVGAGTSVSYGGTWTSARPTTLGLVPLGYADGIPRAAGGRIEVAIGGRRYPAVGRTAMDQFVVDLGAGGPVIGDDVVLFGPGDNGEATADEWGDRLDTIGYEIVTRIGVRVPRIYSDGSGPVPRENGPNEP